MRYAGLTYAEHLTDQDLLALAEARGLTFGVLGSQSVKAAMSWFGSQYEVNLQALRDLGLIDGLNDEQAVNMPSFDEVMDDLEAPALLRLGRRRQMGFKDNLVVYPGLQTLGIRGTDAEPGFIPRFARKEGAHNQPDFSGDTWATVGDTDPVHDTAGYDGWNVAVVLDAGSDLDQNGFGKEVPRGLLYTGMTTDEQRKVLAVDQASHEFGPSILLTSTTLPQIIMINAQRRIKGEALLDDQDTFTRLPHYPDVSVVGEPRTLSVQTEAGKLRLGESPAKKRFPEGGIRESIQVLYDADEPEESAESAAGQA